MISDRPLALQEAPIFHGLSPEESAALAAVLQVREFAPGEDLLRMGEPSPGLYVIRSGLVSAIVRDQAGKERELCTLGRGECVGEMALLTGEPCSSWVRAVSETDAWLLEPAQFAELMEHHPSLWRNVGRVLSQRLARTSRNLATQVYANTTVLIIDAPDEEASLLALGAGESVARQTGRRTLLVDSRGPNGGTLTGMSPVPMSPGFAALLHDRKLLKQHETPPDASSPLSGARVCVVREEDEPEVAPDALAAVLEWLRPLYEHVIVLARPEPGAVRSELLRSGGGVSAVVAGGWVDDVPGWVADIARAGDLRPKLYVSVLTGEMADSTLIQSVENATGRPARRLDMSLAGLRSQNGGGGAEAATRTALDRLGRQIAGKEVGLALGAGAAKGFAHIGVLEVLQENRVPIDFLVGTSIGAVVGAGFASGLPLDEVEGHLRGADRKLARWTLPFRSIWSDAGLIEMLRGPVPNTRFRDLRIPFAAVATDITSGREVVLRRGLVWKAAQASATVPGIFPPVTTRGRQLVDGGLVNPVPGQTVHDLGADIVIAVDLMSPSARSGGALESLPTPGDALKTRIPNLVEILWRSNEIMQEEVTLRSAATADVTIEPKLGRVRWSDFSKRGPQYRQAGEQAAREKMPEIRALLGAAIPGNQG